MLIVRQYISILKFQLKKEIIENQNNTDKSKQTND